MKRCELLLLPHLGVTPDPDSLRVSVVLSSSLKFCMSGAVSGHAGHSRSCSGEQSFKSRRESRKIHSSFLGYFEVCEKFKNKCSALVCSYWYFWKLMSSQC